MLAIALVAGALLKKRTRQSPLWVQQTMLAIVLEARAQVRPLETTHHSVGGDWKRVMERPCYKNANVFARTIFCNYHQLLMHPL